MRQIILASLTLVSLTGCVSWTNKVYGAECEREGHALGTSASTNCIEGKKRAAQLDAQQTIAAGVVVAAVANASPGGGTSMQQSMTEGTLIGQSLVEFTRICRYQTSGQTLEVRLPSTNSCPERMAFQQ
jgi:hypothetical protein